MIDQDILLNAYISGALQIKTRIAVQKKPTTFLRDTFFPGSKGFTQEVYPLDLRRNGTKVTPQTVLGSMPNLFKGNHDYKTLFVAPQYYFDEATVNLDTGRTRVWGEDPTAPLSLQERNVRLMAEKLQQIIDSHEMNEEVAVTDVLFNGKFDSSKAGEMTYPITSGILDFAAEKSWSTTGSKPLSDIKKLGLLLQKNGGVMAYRLIMNLEDLQNLTERTELVTLLDTRNFAAGNIDYQAMNEQEAAFNGYVKVPGFGAIQVYTYSGQYVDKDGVSHPYIPKGKAILGGNPVGFMGRGPVAINNGGSQEIGSGKNVAYGYTRTRGALVDTFIQVQDAPAPMLSTIDSWGVINEI